MGKKLRITYCAAAAQPNAHRLSRYCFMNMPRLSGVDVLCAVPGSETFPVCVVTRSVAERTYVEDHFAPRGVSYVVKPLDREKLLEYFQCYDHLRSMPKNWN
jgi:DNA-binding response OmpR family regulator